VDGLNSFYVTKNNGTSIRVGAEVDTNTALGSSDNKIPSQLAVKTYVDNSVAGGAVSSVEGLTGAVDLVAGNGIAITTVGQDITFTNTGVTGINGVTGAIGLTGSINQIDVYKSGSSTFIVGLPNDVKIAGNLAVDGGDITTADTSANIFASNADSIYIGLNDAVDVRIGKNDSSGDIVLYGSVSINNGILTGPTDSTSTIFATSTTLNVGYNSTASSTTNINTGAVGSGNTKTLNIGTGGAAGSTTNINLGSSEGGTVTVNKDLVVSGDLTVSGTTTTINSTTLTVDDKNIELGSVASPDDTTANGGGITLRGSTGNDKSIIWDSANSNWTSSEHWNLATGKVFKINNTEVLSASALGSGVTGSSLTSVGTITSGTWNGTVVGLAYGGSGKNLTASAGAVVYSDSDSFEFTSVGSSGQVLTSAGTSAPTWTSQSSLSVGSATTATNLAGGVTGDIAYQTGISTTGFLTTSATAGAVVASTGSGTAPEYKVISLTNGSVTSGSGTLTLAVQNAAADGSTKGLATFDATNFNASSGLITIDTVDGGTFV
jgi:hypothetical protein